MRAHLPPAPRPPVVRGPGQVQEAEEQLQALRLLPAGVRREPRRLHPRRLVLPRGVEGHQGPGGQVLPLAGEQDRRGPEGAHALRRRGRELRGRGVRGWRVRPRGPAGAAEPDHGHGRVRHPAGLHLPGAGAGLPDVHEPARRAAAVLRVLAVHCRRRWPLQAGSVAHACHAPHSGHYLVHLLLLAHEQLLQGGPAQDVQLCEL
mmetsp:Transcript_119203/g.337955  ORF Transcript_119203/g.337955 Transcript_119203/m.337955 type:complete len:204 (-) Transcript_119203:295-906(-)